MDKPPFIPNLSIYQNSSPRNSPKNLSSRLKAIHVPPLTPKISLKPEMPKKTDLMTINFNKNFKLRKTVIEERSGSSSPRIREEAKLNHICLEDDGLMKKYKKIRLENQEIQIKINGLYSELEKLQSDDIDLKIRVELCFQILDLTFQ